MSLQDELKLLSVEMRTMTEVLDRLGKSFRLTISFDGESYVTKLEVAEGCMIGGWMEIINLKALLRWLASKV